MCLYLFTMNFSDKNIYSGILLLSNCNYTPSFKLWHFVVSENLCQEILLSRTSSHDPVRSIDVPRTTAGTEEYSWYKCSTDMIISWHVCTVYKWSFAHLQSGHSLTGYTSHQRSSNVFRGDSWCRIIPCRMPFLTPLHQCHSADRMPWCHDTIKPLLHKWPSVSQRNSWECVLAPIPNCPIICVPIPISVATRQSILTLWQAYIKLMCVNLTLQSHAYY